MRCSQKHQEEKQIKKLTAWENDKEELEKIKQQLKIRWKEEMKLLEAPRRTPIKIYPYKGCMIEQHTGCFMAIAPNGRLLKKLFYSMESVKKDIDNYLRFITQKEEEWESLRFSLKQTQKTIILYRKIKQIRISQDISYKTISLYEVDKIITTKPVYKGQKTVFNLSAYDRELEKDFIMFLDRADEALALD